MSSQPYSYVAPDEYLERERTAETKHEWVAGEIIAMAGGSLQHALIVANVCRELGNRLLGRCSVFSSDARVCVSWKGLITYPDVTVLCGAPQFTDAAADTLTNPTFVAEVLSPSIRNFDRGEKGRLYRALPSLAGYLLIDQKPAEIEYFRRLPNGNWEVAAISDINARLTLDALGCELPVSDIYRGLDLL